MRTYNYKRHAWLNTYHLFQIGVHCELKWKMTYKKTTILHTTYIMCLYFIIYFLTEYYMKIFNYSSRLRQYFLILICYRKWRNSCSLKKLLKNTAVTGIYYLKFLYYTFYQQNKYKLESALCRLYVRFLFVCISLLFIIFCYVVQLF